MRDYPEGILAKRIEVVRDETLRPPAIPWGELEAAHVVELLKSTKGFEHDKAEFIETDQHMLSQDYTLVNQVYDCYCTDRIRPEGLEFFSPSETVSDAAKSEIVKYIDLAGGQLEPVYNLERSNRILGDAELFRCCNLLDFLILSKVGWLNPFDRCWLFEEYLADFDDGSTGKEHVFFTDTDPRNAIAFFPKPSRLITDLLKTGDISLTDEASKKAIQTGVVICFDGNVLAEQFADLECIHFRDGEFAGYPSLEVAFPMFHNGLKRPSFKIIAMMNLKEEQFIV